MPSRSWKKTNAPSAIGVLVVHNKLKPKKGTLLPDVTYIAGEHVPNVRNCYPWDAKAYGCDIYEHEKLGAPVRGGERAAELGDDGGGGGGRGCVRGATQLGAQVSCGQRGRRGEWRRESREEHV